MEQQEKGQGTNKLETGSIWRLMISLSIPSIIAQLVGILYNMVDRMFIGRIENGTTAMAALSVSLPLITCITAFTRLVGIGGAPLCAIKMGQKAQKGAEEILGVSFASLITVGAILTVVILLFKRPILTLFGADETTLELACDYVSIYALGTIFVMIALGMNSYITTQGFCQGAQPIISYNYGAGNYSRVRRACCISHVLCITFATCLTSLMMLFPRTFAGIFSNDQSLLHFSSWALPIYLAGGAIFGAQISCQQSFMALGQAKISLLLACLRKVILLAPLIYLFPVTVGKLPFAAAMAQEIAGLVEYPAEVFSIFLAEPVSDITAAICTSITFYIFYRKSLRKADKK